MRAAALGPSAKSWRAGRTVPPLSLDDGILGALKEKLAGAVGVETGAGADGPLPKRLVPPKRPPANGDGDTWYIKGRQGKVAWSRTLDGRGGVGGGLGEGEVGEGLGLGDGGGEGEVGEGLAGLLGLDGALERGGARGELGLLLVLHILVVLLILLVLLAVLVVALAAGKRALVVAQTHHPLAVRHRSLL